MSTRFTAEYTTINTNDDIKVSITDSSFSGTVKELDGTGADWFTDSLQRINVKQPLESRIQNRQISVSLWVEEEQFITDLFSSQEGRFKILYDKNSSREWEGYILPDLCSYEEREADRWKLTIVAKDFSVLEGDDFGSAVSDGDDRVKIIESIAGILGEKYDIDIYSQTEWIVDGTTTTGDFLNQIYIDEFTLREFARTGNEEDELISLKEALDRILKACGCVIRQVSGRFYIQQLTGLDNPLSVNEFQYNSAGVLQTTTSANLVNSITPLRASTNEHNPGIKSARLKYEHRSTVTDISFPSIVNLTDVSQTQTFSQFFVGTGDEQLNLTGRIRGFSTTNTTDGRAELTIKSGTLYYDGSEWNTTATNRVTIDMLGGGLLIDGEYVYSGFIDVTTAPIPLTNSGNIDITLRNVIIENSPDEQADRTEYDNLDFSVIGATDNENSISIDYKLTQSGVQSVKADYGKIYFGDGPAASSRGGFSEDVAGETGTNNNWASRGEVSFIPHAQILLREFLDVQRSSRRRISAIIKDSLEWLDVVSYDGSYFYNLGGTFNGYTGDYSTESLELDIQTGSDTFEDLPKFLPEGVTSSETTSAGSSPTDGITEGEADALYLQQVNNLNDLDNALTARSNLGLVIGTDVQSHSSALDDYSSNFLTASELDQLQNINAVTILNSQWGYLGSLNQNLATTSSPAFNNLSLTGALDSGSITSGFGNIDIGSNNISSGEILVSDNVPTLKLIESDITDKNAWVLVNNGIYQVQERNDAGSFVDNPFEINFGSFIDLNLDTRVSASFDVSGNIEGGTLDILGLATVNSLDVTTTADVGGLATIDSLDVTTTALIGGKLTHNASIESDNFSLGTASTGWGFDGADGFGAIDNSGSYHLYTDDLTVRGRLRVFELVVKQISAIGGTEILSVAVGEADSVSGSAGSETVTMTDPNNAGVTSLAANDLIVVAQFDINDPNNLVKQEFRTVSSVSGLDVTFTSTAGAPAPSASIEEGDVIVQYGNTTDTSRQSIIYRNVEGNPQVRLQSGINSYSDFNSPASTTEVAYGDLNGLVTGISSQEFGMAIGDMTLTGNHVLLTDSQASLKFDVFDLEAGDLRINSADPSITLDGGGFDAVSINTDSYTTEEYSSTINAEFVTLYDDGLPTFSSGSPYVIGWSDIGLATSVLTSNDYYRLTAFELQANSSTTNADVTITLEARVGAGAWFEVSQYDVITGQSISTSFTKYTFDQDLEFFVEPGYDEFRLQIFVQPDTAQNFTLGEIYAQDVQSSTVLNETNLDVMRLRACNRIEMTNPFDPSDKLVLEYRKDTDLSGNIEYKADLIFVIDSEFKQRTNLATYTP